MEALLGHGPGRDGGRTRASVGRAHQYGRRVHEGRRVVVGAKNDTVPGADRDAATDTDITGQRRWQADEAAEYRAPTRERRVPDDPAHG